MNIKEAIEQAFDLSRDPGIEHFVMVLGLIDQMPLAAIAPLSQAKLLTDYEDKAKIVRTLRRLADAIESQPFDVPAQQDGQPPSREEIHRQLGVVESYDYGKQLIKAPKGGLVVVFETIAIMHKPGYPEQSGVVTWQVDERLLKRNPRTREAIDLGVMKAVRDAMEQAGT